MAEFNTYPVFVADQVLTADHLNEIVNYLDEQDRLTRNKLIGIGIVCGLEIKATTEQIEVSKGCGVTSEGYLIVQDENAYTHFRPYNLPEYFSPKYKPVYEDWQMWELLTTENSLEFDDAVFIKHNPNFMKSKAVVLLLEKKDKPLKNCIETDCDDKGDEVIFNVKPLLIDKKALDNFIRNKEEKLESDEPQPSVQPKLQSIQLRRFNVPVKELNNTNDVFNAFLQLVDEGTLKKISEVLNYCYFHYKPILGVDSNPFINVFETFKDTLEQVKNNNPFFIQYFYDWISDIVNTYYEFKGRIFDVQAICCPDEDLFPLHLMLGEANKDTDDDTKSKYRQYFIYSPLFNEQKDRLAEVKMLFDKLIKLVGNFVIPNPNTFNNAPVKITPSRYYDKPLSNRSIPYYYNPIGLFSVWNWYKTRKGNEKYNLSYHAARYNNDDAIVYPLKYDIERYNFFRIEGHIGKSFSNALTAVINQRDQNNLPFDVVALSTATVSQFFSAKDYECQFNDLESIYKVLLAELMCKLGDFECMAAKIPYQVVFDNIFTRGDVLTGGVSAERTGFTINTNIDAGSLSLADRSSVFSGNILTNLGAAVLKLPDYVRGDFLKSHCTIVKGSIGEAYLNAVKNGVFFTRPSQVNRNTNVFATNATASSNSMYLIYAYLFYFIDSVENIFAVSLNKSMEDLDPDVFNARYKVMRDVVEELAKIGEYLEQLDPTNENYAELLKNLKAIGFYDFAVRIHVLLHACLDERFEALKKEYERRKKELQLLTNFMNYFKRNPGMEHKAGVPKGGTFILVYHETPPRRLIADLVLNRNLIANLPGALSAVALENKDLANVNELIKASYVQDPKLLKNFELALGKFLDTCKDMDDDAKDQIKQVLVSIPDEPEPLKFRVPEQSVIADFYLPYICCSECPPISYVVPKTPEDVLSISIKPTEFCNDDERVYPVRVSPQGGQLTASDGGIAEGSLEFAPKGVKAGVNTLTYTLADGRSTSIDVMISGSFNVSFKFKILEDGVTVQFLPTSGANDREVLWDFGDDSTSTELSPEHTYQFEEQKQIFKVVLTVTDAPCVKTAEQEISLEKPAENAFDLIPKIFCIRDTKEYDFNIHPLPTDLTEIKNEDKLIINQDAANNRLFFVPAKHKIKTTKDFHLEYLGIPLDLRVIVADGTFFIDIRQVENDFQLTLRASQEDATQYLWNINQGDLSYQFKKQKINLSLNELKLAAGRDIAIGFAIGYQLPSGNCEDRKEFNLTEGIFFKHVDNGEFDNNTTE